MNWILSLKNHHRFQSLTIISLALFAFLWLGCEAGVEFENPAQSTSDSAEPFAGDPSLNKGSGMEKFDSAAATCQGWTATEAELKAIYDNLLILVDRHHALPENYYNYIKPRLSAIHPFGEVSYLHPSAAEAFKKMRTASGSLVKINYGYTSYRSFQNQCEDIYQACLKNPNKCATPVPKYAALAGHSEHEAGLAVDIHRQAHGWLYANAHQYGFVQSYPEGYAYCTGYNPEPWHWRYVGVEAAQIMRQNGLIAHEFLNGLRCDGSPIEDITVAVIDTDGNEIQTTLFEARQASNQLLYHTDVAYLCSKLEKTDESTCSASYPSWLMVCNEKLGTDLKNTYQWCLRSCTTAAEGDDTCRGGLYDFFEEP